MNKKIVHDALVLFAFTVVLGLILGVVYGITKGPIDQVNYEKTQSAYKQVFEDADSFEEYADFDTAAAEDLMAQNGYSDDIEAVNTALDASGNPLGYVLTVTAKDGSQGSITLMSASEPWYGQRLFHHKYFRDTGLKCKSFLEENRSTASLRART